MSELVKQVVTNVASISRRKLTVVILASVLTLILFRKPIVQSYTGPPKPFSSPSDRLSGPTQHSFDNLEWSFRLVIPATQPNSALCQTLVSAKMLGYPPPTLINWMSSDDSGGDESTTNGSATARAKESHIRKVVGMKDLPKSWGEKRRDQLVLMIDGYDMWFQLPSSILRQRYLDVSLRLFDRTVELLGSRAVEAAHISQSIISSAEKNCGPWRKQRTEVGCYGAPEPPTRKDLYGEMTDKRPYPSRHPGIYMRPAFLNSGFLIGTVGTMRSLMERAMQKVEEGEDRFAGSDQYIFNEVFGEQQYWRELQRQRYRTMIERLTDGFKKILGAHTLLMTDPHPTHKPAEVTADAGDGTIYEFGLGLDYGLELTQAMVMSEHDGRFIVYGDPDKTQQVLREANTPTAPRIQDLPIDLANDTATSGTDWARRPLYTNLYTASVPVTIHLNGDSAKHMRETLWEDMWFIPTAKARFQNLDKPITIARDVKENDLYWQDLCEQYQSELF